MKTKPHTLSALLTILIMTLVLGGCLFDSSSSEPLIECSPMKPGESTGYQMGSWTQGWDARYADYRGRYLCKVEITSGCEMGTDYYIYQFSCSGGRCSCQAGNSLAKAPYNTAEFSATSQDAFASAAKLCQFRDNVKNVEVAPWKPANGAIYTLAGNGKQGHADGGLHQATLDSPLAVADDGQGTLFLSSSQSMQLRMITGGQVKTVGDTVYGYADGPLATAQFQGVQAMTSDQAGMVYLADGLRIRVIKSGAVTTIASNGSKGCGDGPALAATFGKPVGLALASDGALYIADEYCKSIRLMVNGVVSTVAGNPKGKVHSGPVDAVRFISVRDVALDGKGRIYVMGLDQIKVLEAGMVSDLPVASSDQFFDVRRLVSTAKGDLFALAAGTLWKLQGGKMTPGISSWDLMDPRDAAVDSAGRILIADRGGHKVLIYLP